MDLPDDARSFEISKFPNLIRNALRAFKRLTGLTAVATLGTPSSDAHPLNLVLPAVHPRCAQLMRETPDTPPCETEWRRHLRFAEKTQRCRKHTCPLGLQCACVPVVLGDEVLGLAKCVVGSEVSAARFGYLVGILEVLISRSCHEFHVLRLREEVRALQTSVDLLRQAKKPNPPVEATTDRSTAHGPTRIGSNDAQAVVSRALEFLDEHFAEGQLCLADVAGALGKNEKYISHLFARHVGVRMRTYITMLRLRRASALLLQTGRPIEQIAAEAGFSHVSHFRQSFRRSTGLTASKYRQIFASSGPGKIA